MGSVCAHYRYPGEECIQCGRTISRCEEKIADLRAALSREKERADRLAEALSDMLRPVPVGESWANCLVRREAAARAALSGGPHVPE